MKTEDKYQIQTEWDRKTEEKMLLMGCYFFSHCFLSKTVLKIKPP